MRRLNRKKKIFFLVLLVAFVYLNNTSLFTRQEDGKPLLLAHRGLAQTNDRQEGELLAQYLEKLPEERLNRLTVYGGDEPIDSLKQNLPKLRVMSKATMKKALISYMAVGWTGYMPESMKNTYFHLPLKYARVLWGWPHRFINRIEDANSYFVIVAGDGAWSEGFDTLVDLEQIPTNYEGGIWTTA